MTKFLHLPPHLSRRSLLKWLGGMGLLLAGGGCTGTDSGPEPLPEATLLAANQPTPRPQPSLLRVAFSSPPKTFDPARMSISEEYHVAFALYEALIWIDTDLLPQPLLASSWETAPDLLTWTFALQRGRTFHNGADVTANDVVYTFERLLDPDLGASLFALTQAIARVEAIDAYTVQFHLTAPNAELLYMLAAPQTGIVPTASTTNALNALPVGSGPYRFMESLPGGRRRLQHFPQYPEAEEYSLQTVEYHYFSTLAAQADALLAGHVEMIADINLQDLTRLREHPEIVILEVPSGRYQTLVMQATEAPFTDLRVRQALKACADRPLLLEQAMRGYGELGHDHPVAPVSAFVADLPLPEQNVERARQLLAEAGYPDGLKLDLITSDSRPGMLVLAESFSQMAALAGIQIRVTRVPADVYWSDYGGKVPFHVGNWNFRVSIDETFTLAHYSKSPQNESKWSTPELDALLDQARSEANQETRMALYHKAQQIVQEQGAVVIPYFRPVLMAVQRKVQGFAGHPAGWIDLYGVTIEGAA